MKTAPLICAALLVSCGGPSEHHPVADFAIDCRDGHIGSVQTAAAMFAKQSGLTFNVPQASTAEVNMTLDGGPGLGHHIMVDWSAVGRLSGPTPCVSDKHPCVVVTALSGGPLSEEMSEASVAQRQTAMTLKERLEAACRGNI